jgi:hypothetical protein
LANKADELQQRHVVASAKVRYEQPVATSN